MEFLTENEVLKILKEDSYLSSPEDYRPGMIIDETPKAIRDNILNDNNKISKHVEGALETIKRLNNIKSLNKYQ